MNPRHSSLTAEHYTPPDIVEAARRTLGDIDLDPASCDLTYQYVNPAFAFTLRGNGYLQPWWGRVFLNPPGGKCDLDGLPVVKDCDRTGACGLPAFHAHDGRRSSQKAWWFKLAREYITGRVEAAVFVCFSVELLQTTQVGTPKVIGGPLDGHDLPTPLDFPICFPSRRVSYLHEQGGQLTVGASPPHASCIVHLPSDEASVVKFEKEFNTFGRIK